MSIVRNLTAVAIELDDLGGITVPASGDYDLKEENGNDIANSQDLNAAIIAGSVVFLDNSGTALTQQESINTQDNISATQPAIGIQENGTSVTGTPHSIINFTGNGISVTDAGNGIANIDAFIGLGFTTIGGEEILTLTDSTRANKILSVEKINLLYAHGSVTNDTYLDIAQLSSSLVGYIVPLNATIVGATLHVEDGNTTTIEYDLYVNDSLFTSNIISASVNGETVTQINNLNIDVSASDKLIMRGNRTSGSSSHKNVSLMLYLKWRG